MHILPSLIAFFAVLISALSIWLSTKNIEKQIKSAENTAHLTRMADFNKVWVFELQNELSNFLMLTFQNRAAFETSQFHERSYPNDTNQEKIQAECEISFHKVILSLDPADELHANLITSVHAVREAESSNWIDLRNDVIAKTQLVFKNKNQSGQSLFKKI